MRGDGRERRRSGHDVDGVWVQDGVRPEEAGDSVEAFLHHLGGPTLLRIPGENRTRRRAIVTLLHGNEPSGARALRDLVARGVRPRTDLVCFVGAVQAALADPGFAHRMLPGCRDLNRCFREPFEGVEGRTAKVWIDEMRRSPPEAIVDVHNTSGAGPSYGVTTRVDDPRRALTSLFTSHLIVTDLRLGSVMEVFEESVPTVTIECGGARDPDADRVALDGLERFVTRDDVCRLDPVAASPTILENPVRLELAPEARVAYEREPAHGADVTLRADVDGLAFRDVPAGEALGWLGSRGLEALVSRTSSSTGPAAPWFAASGNRFVTARKMRIFMVTTNPAIALSDCLFYFIPEDREAEG